MNRRARHRVRIKFDEQLQLHQPPEGTVDELGPHVQHSSDVGDAAPTIAEPQQRANGLG
jgi:hypothetical protein